jgi:site-specific DNA-cytosine methylase
MGRQSNETGEHKDRIPINGEDMIPIDKNESKDVLVACEESQTLTKALRKKGIKAFSCDLQDCSGGHPEWHIKTDVSKILSYGWKAILAFPPCTHLASSGARWFKEKQKDGRQQKAIEFFMLFANHPCPIIMIENPIGIMNTRYRKPDQIIQPWQYGHGETKATCLWLKGLPKLTPTNIVTGREQRIWKMAPSKDRSKERSKTYQGIADAMVDQWHKYLV